MWLRSRTCFSIVQEVLNSNPSTANKKEEEENQGEEEKNKRSKQLQEGSGDSEVWKTKSRELVYS